MLPSTTTADGRAGCRAGSLPPAAAAADLAATWLLLAHEMRTPLTAIMGACELALAGPTRGAGHAVQALLRDIARAARRLDRTVSTLADWQLTAPPSTPAVWIDLAAACADAGLGAILGTAPGAAVWAERSRLHAVLTSAGRWLGRGDRPVEVLLGLRPPRDEVGAETVLRLEGGPVAAEVGDLGRLDLVLCRWLIEGQGGRLVDGGVTLELCWPAQPAAAPCPAIDRRDISA